MSWVEAGERRRSGGNRGRDMVAPKEQQAGERLWMTLRERLPMRRLIITRCLIFTVGIGIFQVFQETILSRLGARSQRDVEVLSGLLG
jgi:hypothetical protein